MADITGRDIVTDALVDIGVLSEGETPTAIMAAGGLLKMNQMIDSWNLERPLLFGSVGYVISLSIGQTSYTIGPGGDLDIPYPTSIFSAFIRTTGSPITNTLDTPIEILDQQGWANIAYKQLPANFPFLGIYIDDSYPLKTVYINPIPSAAGYSLVLWMNNPLGEITLNGIVAFPPGYARAITSNLSIELQPSYGDAAVISEATVKIASSSLAAIRAKNLQVPELMVPTGVWYDIQSNRYIIR